MPENNKSKNLNDSKKSDLNLEKSRKVLNNNRGRRLVNKVVYISTIAWTTIAIIAIGIFIGYYLDLKFETNPIFLLLMSIFGIISSIYFIFNFSKTYNK